MSTLPLLPEANGDHVVAYRNGLPVTRADLLRDVRSIAATLPATEHVLNLCKDRYWFAASLLAAISRNIKTYLPNTTAREYVASLQKSLPLACRIGDHDDGNEDDLPYRNIASAMHGANHGVFHAPSIPGNRPVLTIYTSGSTGKPQPHQKTFQRLHQNAAAEADVMWKLAGGECSVVGTVPSQHMYGLESTILLPMLCGGRLSSRIPFFPKDIAEALAETPPPRLLVTTPFHLRNLLDADIEIPPVAGVLSATAMLPSSLAIEAERRLNAPLAEIYGSTETGQIAFRRPVRHSDWIPYPGIHLDQAHGKTAAKGGHLEREYDLNDAVEITDSGTFHLLGRNSDIVNIAGKRSSLGYLSHILTGLPGVHDGVYFLPECDEPVRVTRLAAFVVAPQLTSSEILSALRKHVDPLFLPRPIIFVPSLPRNGTGKIPAEDLDKFIAAHHPR